MDTTTTSPSASRHCPQCAVLLPGEAPQGLCPKCLMAAAMATQVNQLVPLGVSRDEVVAAFPELEIHEILGVGGMGVVFRARQVRLDRMVALKILPRPAFAQPDFAARFVREGRVLAKLNHPHIVTVYDYGEAGGFHFLLMEYIDGVNLRQAMRAGRFTPEQALAIIPGICDALQYAHNEGVLHRDIKPENILLDAKGRVKIADFGIAKLVSAGPTDITLTQAGVQLGTPAYMAPEQIEKPSTVDHRADIYSLGVVFYEMLTGELPLGRFGPPSGKSAVSSSVDEVVMRTLAREPADRYQSAGEVKTQVENLDSAPVPGTFDRITESRCPEINRWGWLLVPLAFILLTSLFSGGSADSTGLAIAISIAGGALWWWANREGLIKKWLCVPPPITLLENGSASPCLLSTAIHLASPVGRWIWPHTGKGNLYLTRSSLHFDRNDLRYTVLLANISSIDLKFPKTLVAPKGLAHLHIAFDDQGQQRTLMLSPNLGWLATGREKKAAAQQWITSLQTTANLAGNHLTADLGNSTAGDSNLSWLKLTAKLALAVIFIGMISGEGIIVAAGVVGAASFVLLRKHLCKIRATHE